MNTLNLHFYIDLGSDYTGWKEITSDVLQDNPIRWNYGVRSNKPADKVGQTGVMALELDNSSDNSAGLAGYYSPGHSDCLTGFDIGNYIRAVWETQACQDTSYIIVSDTPASDLFNTDTQIIYNGTTEKTDGSFGDGLYYPVFDGTKYAIYDTDTSTIIQSLNLDNHTISFWFRLSTDNPTSDSYMPEVSFKIETDDETISLLEKFETIITATDATIYPTFTRTLTDGGGPHVVTVTQSDASLSTSWTHCAMTVCASDAEVRFYVNGQYITGACTSDYQSASTDTFTKLYIRMGDKQGSMAHFAVYNHVLDSDEIGVLYNQNEFQWDAVLGCASVAPIIYYVMGAKSASSSAASYAEQNRAVRYTYANLESGYKPTMGFYEFFGRIANIDAMPGKFGERKTKIELVDWMDDASNVNVGSVPTMVGVTADQVLAMMIQQTAILPPSNDFDTGATTLSYALGTQSGNNSLYSELKRIAASEPGLIYMRGGAGSDGEIGGILCFENKSARFQKTTTDFEMGEDPNSDTFYSMDIERSIDNLYNCVEATIYPTEVDTDYVPLYTMSPDLTPTIPALGELVMNVKYTDTDEAFTLVGAAEVLQPERNVDYTINSRADGLGNDKSNDVRCTIAATSSDDLIGYWIMGEQSGFVLSNYVRPSGVGISQGGSNTGDGYNPSSTGSTSFGTVGWRLPKVMWK
jgi:hypothetical protein